MFKLWWDGESFHWATQSDMAFKLYGLFICVIFNLLFFDLVIFISFWAFHHLLLLKSGWLWVTKAIQTREKGKHNGHYSPSEKEKNVLFVRTWWTWDITTSTIISSYWIVATCTFPSKMLLEIDHDLVREPRLIVSLHLTFMFSGRFLFTEEAMSIRDIRSIFISRNVKWVVVWSIPKKTGRGYKCCLFLALKYWSEKEGVSVNKSFKIWRY